MSETEIMDYLKLAISSLCGDRIHFSTSNKAADEHTKQARLVGQWLDEARASSPDPAREALVGALNLLREYREFHYGVRAKSESGGRTMCLRDDNRCDLCKRADSVLAEQGHKGATDV